MATTSTTLLRTLAQLTGLLGVFVYLYLAYSAIVPGWYQTPDIHESWRGELGYIVQDVVFFPGLPPVIVAIYFLVLGGTRRDWRAGFAFLLGFIAFHYIVAVWMAHGSAMVYIPMMIAELFAAIWLVWYWRRKRMSE